MRQGLDSRLRTADFHKLWMLDFVELTEQGYAKVPATDVVPDEYSDFSMYGMVPLVFKRIAACHFYLDDYRFERVWNKPEMYLDILSDYKAVIQPDFSLYRDMPVPIQKWNKYRSNLLAAYWAAKGIPVVPNLVWSDESSYEWCFEGIPKNSVVSTTALGAIRDKEAYAMWKDGFTAALEATQPHTVLFYGQIPDYEFPSGVVVKAYKNRRVERVRNKAPKHKEDK